MTTVKIRITITMKTKATMKMTVLMMIIKIFAGKGPFPGLLDMYGLMGGINEARAALLASKGFATLAVPYYRYEGLPDNLFDLNFDYFKVCSALQL
jgi:hypothetical protein